MANECQRTLEEEAYERLVGDNQETLSEAALTILGEASGAAYTMNLMANISYQPQEYDEVMEKMSLAATKLTSRDRELLMGLTRRALIASASVDLYDEETLVGHRVYRRDVHYFYRMIADLIECTLYEQFIRERLADQETKDILDVPF